jgi:LuxR family maltose regulon positive regulatory protein
MIEGHIDHVLFLGERLTLKRWLDMVPRDAIVTRPQLTILQAGVLFLQGQIKEAAQFLDEAEQALNLDPWKQERSPLREQLLGRAAVIRAFLVAFDGDVEGSLAYAQKALDWLPSDDYAWRASALDCIGTTYSYLGDVEKAYDVRMRTLDASRDTGNMYMILFAGMRLVVTLREMGRLGQAIGICQQQLQMAHEHGLAKTSIVGWLYTLWGEMLAERNDLDRALELATKGVELTKRGMDMIILGSSYLSLMRVLYSRGEFDQAQSIIYEISRQTQRPDFPASVESQLAAWQALIWLAKGNLTAANQWADSKKIDFDQDPDPQYDFDYVVLVRIFIAQKQDEACRSMLQKLLTTARLGGRVSKTIELLVLDALCSQAGGKTDRALKSLEEALALAEPEGFMRIFLDEGEPMVDLLRQARQSQIATDYVDNLLAGGLPVDQSGLIEPLSERELEVLRLLAEGLTNKAIGEHLYLALNTVKVHTRNIYGKLGVNNRTQAVVRARELGLLAAF